MANANTRQREKALASLVQAKTRSSFKNMVKSLFARKVI
jgi:hypothetical protein